VSVDFNKVRCHDREFDIVSKDVGERVSPSIDRDLNYIDNFMCIGPEDFEIELKPYMKEWHRLYFQRANKEKSWGE